MADSRLPGAGRPPRRWRPLVIGLALVALLAVAIVARRGASGTAPVTLRFWAMGREGEVVGELVHEFEREHPGIRVIVQQIPWGAAHAKLLTAYVGGSTPDVGQLGNTWVAEFGALRAILPLDARVAGSVAVRDTAYFPGIWDTNVLDHELYGIPWYVDTRVIFYRRDLLLRAGYRTVPQTWGEWRRAMETVKRQSGGKTFGIFLPTNEYTPWVVLGQSAGSPLLKDHDTRGAFSEPPYRRAADFFVGMFRDGLAPAVTGAAIANVYQEFERGTFAMYITGPWQLGEFKNRLAPEHQDLWDTAPIPGPDGPGVSSAGGSSLVLFRNTKHPEQAWQLIEFLSRPELQVRFFALTGDLPARRVAWRDTALANAPHMGAFADQLTRVVPTPKVPEWEQVSVMLQDRIESIVLGHAPIDSALRALDRDVDRALEKRRWLLEHGAPRAGALP